MLLSHVAEAEEMLSTPYVVLAPELPVHAELPLEPGKTQSSLAQKARCLRHADQFVRRGDVLDVNMRATLKSGGVFLRIATGKGWVAEQSVLGEKALEPADVTPCNGIFRVLTDVLRYARRPLRAALVRGPCAASHPVLCSPADDGRGRACAHVRPLPSPSVCASSRAARTSSSRRGSQS